MATQSKFPGFAVSASEQKDLADLRKAFRERVKNLIAKLDNTQKELTSTRGYLRTIENLCTRAGVESAIASEKGKDAA